MNEEELLAELRAGFVLELEELVAALGRDLLALEKETDPAARAELVGALFRSMHTIKGAARATSLLPLEQAAGAVEDVLSRVRDGTQPFDRELADLLLWTTDAFDDARARLASGQSVEGGRLAELAPRLLGQAAAPAAADAAAPAPAPAPAASSAQPLALRLSPQKLDRVASLGDDLARAAGDEAADRAGAQLARDLVHEIRQEWALMNRVERRNRPPAARAAADRAEVRLVRLERTLAELDTVATRTQRATQQAASRFEAELRQLRFVPFAEAVAGLDRAARDVSVQARKPIALHLDGGDVELDRVIVNELREPLLHLVRNAVDHGIEAPDVRAGAGKPAAGRITVSATLRGDQVEVAVSDDGRGLDRAALAAKARARGMDASDDRALAQVAFLPGVSTAAFISDVSGRGVGLDVVKRRIEAVHGAVDLSFEPGQGTRITLRLPVTLSQVRVVVVSAGGTPPRPAERRHRAADPRAARERRRRRGQGRPPRPWPDGDAGVPGRGPGHLRAAHEGPGHHPGGHHERRRAPLRARGRRDHRRAPRRGVEPGRPAARAHPHPRRRDDRRRRPVPILSPSELGARVRATGGRARPVLEPEKAAVRKRILLCDDSVTTRNLERIILESAGYQVTTAVDGEEAWEKLQAQGADLVVSDAEMPRLDGFGLVRAIRGSARFADLPVILVTALASDRDRARGLEAGASAYVVKSAFDQAALLDVIARLL